MLQQGQDGVLQQGQQGEFHEGAMVDGLHLQQEYIPHQPEQQEQQDNGV